MDNSMGNKTQKRRPWEGSRKKNRDKRDRQVGRVLLGEGVACDIIYDHCLLKLRKEVRERRKDAYTTLSGFSGEQNRYCRIGHDAIHNALRSLISVRNRTHVYYVRIPGHKEIGGGIFAIEHKLNEDKIITPVQQRNRGMTPERSATVSKEVEELRKAGILQETRYQT
ncbi:hypothetical protein Tco_1024030, partial [Tanacetum coccineum]